VRFDGASSAEIASLLEGDGVDAASAQACARLALGDLAAEPFVLFPRPVAPGLYDDVIARCRTAGFSPRVVQEAAGWHTLAALVGAGVGVTFVPRSLTTFQRPEVAYRPVRDLSVHIRMSAVWKRGERSPVRERFVTTLRAVARARARVRHSGLGTRHSAEG
jgi:DNA-binding transcriptional LysR family regulator